jgi:hypothetical protein
VRISPACSWWPAHSSIWQARYNVVSVNPSVPPLFTQRILIADLDGTPRA